MADEHHIAQLIAKLLRQDMTAEERQELNVWLDVPANREYMKDKVQLDVILKLLRGSHKMNKEAIWANFEMAIEQENSVTKRAPVVRHFVRYAAAAVLIGFMVTGLYLLFIWNKKKAPILGKTVAQKKADVSLNRARLMLTDSTVILLDTASVGPLARQQGGGIIKEDSNLLVYPANPLVRKNIITQKVEGRSWPMPAMTYNILTVPSRARYRLHLSDGTKVTLEAGSSLRYPVAFTGNERVVELIGEGYFEVHKDELRPFLLHTKRRMVEVLGTEFDVRDYPGESQQRVILKSGKVKMHVGNKAITLKPGQEATISEGDQVEVLSDIDMDSELAWKNGYFNFDRMDIKEAVLVLAQWYGKNVIFEKGIKKGPLGYGNIQQDLPLEELLKDLELPDLHFELRDSLTIVVKK